MPGSRSTGRRKRAARRKGRGGADVGSEAARTRGRWLVPALVVLATLAAFWPVLQNGFVNYDDPDYVTSNSMVRSGLTWPGVRWALTTGHAANWHPVTWLSHMADVSLFGVNPAAHHAVSLLIHSVDALLLFFLLRNLTGATGRSGFVAALFAVHPAHVESVAWISERKDVLSTAFWLLTMVAYVAWVRRRGAGRYLVVLLLFAAGLASKPMLVSLPLVLLLIDYWPLKRWEGTSFPTLLRVAPPDRMGLVGEKAALLLMAAASSIATIVAQRAGGAMRSFEYPLATRLANALVSCVRYLRMLVWPELAVFYPYPRDATSAVTALAAGALVVAMSVAAIRFRRRAPYLFVGWFWFVITLLPVLGLVQVGKQALADRYTYVPFIGLFIAIAWGADALAARWRPGRYALRAAAVAAVVVLVLATRAQVRVWKNSETLFLNALENTKDNYLAHINLGNYYVQEGRPDDAVGHLRDAERIRPDEPEVHVNLGYALLVLDRREEAARSFERVLQLDPDNAVALNNLARLRFLDGDVADALRLYRATVAARPDWAEGRRRLAIAMLMQGETDSALRELERATALDPSDTEARWLADGVRALGRKGDPWADELRRYLAGAHREAAMALRRRGRIKEALASIRKALDLVPDLPSVRVDLEQLLEEEARAGETAEKAGARQSGPENP